MLYFILGLTIGACLGAIIMGLLSVNPTNIDN